MTPRRDFNGMGIGVHGPGDQKKYFGLDFWSPADLRATSAWWRVGPEGNTR
jgi:hypothetical protein